ncbi:MAG: hypothetical protein IT376_15415 [Polyangiaceae bacterium]|nr:hypothetical protein [Polyangiaceae bacterium]
MNADEDVDRTLSELEALVEEERVALRALDARRLGELGELKLSAVAALRAASAGLTAERGRRLRSLRERLLRNQLLLVHARDCARALRGGGPREAGRIGRAPVRLSVRG